MKLICHLNDECVKLIPKTIYLVEANNFESHTLWQNYATEAKEYEGKWKHPRFNWDGPSRCGGLVTVGELAKRPVAVEIWFQKIGDQYIAFYHGSSVVVDHDMIEKWVKKTFPGVPTTNANNFHAAFHRIQDLNKENEMSKALAS